MRRRFVPLALAAMVSLVSAWPAGVSARAPSELTGRVVDADRGGPVAGARVLLLRQGVFVTKSVRTGRDGSFELRDLRAGTYDLQVGAGGFATVTKPDVKVPAAGGSVSIRLRHVAAVVRAQGIPPKWLLTDTDEDGVRDAIEEELGSDPGTADSDGDGVDDGIELFSNVSPVHPTLSGSGKPVIISPSAGASIPVPPAGSPKPPISVVFDPVDGGTSYDLVLTPAGGGSPMSITADFLEGDLQLGHMGMGVLRLPDDISPGTYSLSLKAYHGTTPIGATSDPVPLTLLEVTPDPFVPSSDVDFDGDTTILASSVMIARDVDVTVSSGTLSIYSTGSVDVRGNVNGAPGASPGGAGASIVVTSLDDIVIRGTVRAGGGAAGASASATGTTNEAAEAVGSDGGRGGDVTVVSGEGGEVLIASSGRMAAGRGGDGGDAAATAGDGSVSEKNPAGAGPDATAVGGHGGRGGDLWIFARGGFHAASRRRIFSGGNGGDGGSAAAFGGAGAPPLGVGGLGIALPSVGGESGDLAVPTLDLDRVADDLATPQNFAMIGGGSAGAAGEAEVKPGVSVTGKVPFRAAKQRAALQPRCECPTSTDGKDDIKQKGENGEAGWADPGNGASRVAKGSDATGCGKGGSAEAEGGDGGNLKGISLSIEWFGVDMAGAGLKAGEGGSAKATGGKGGYDGGKGGDAKAVGGKGGSAPGAILQLGLTNYGGAGGSAKAEGGDGSAAPDCCDPPAPALKGGDGGKATARGGDGGAGHLGGNAGFLVEAYGGHGGLGGDGRGPGKGGAPGAADAVSGTPGTGTLLNGSRSVRIQVAGTKGFDGSPC